MEDDKEMLKDHRRSNKAKEEHDQKVEDMIADESRRHARATAFKTKQAMKEMFDDDYAKRRAEFKDLVEH